MLLVLALIAPWLITSKLMTHNQLPTRYDAQAEIDALQLRQKQLNNSLSNIQKEIAKLNKALNDSHLGDSYKTILLQEGLANERDQLLNIENYLKLPFDLRPCNSTNLNETEKQALRNQTDQVQSSLQSLRNQVASCNNCTIGKQISLQIDREEAYLTVIRDVLNSNCSKVPKPLSPQNSSGLIDLTQSMYKNNLNAPNWIYGNITQQDYRLKTFANAIKYNLTSCPIEKPYINPLTNKCFNCPNDMTFNLGKKTCETCPSGSFFNITKNICISNCTPPLLYNSNTGKCQTPVAPINNNTNTIGICPPDNPYWNTNHKMCEECPSTAPAYNPSNNTCLPCPPSNVWSSQYKKCIKNCTKDTVYNPDLNTCTPLGQTCPPNSPVWNPSTSQCEPCPADTHWFQTLNRCVRNCPSGQNNNPQTGNCQPTTTPAGVCDPMKPIWNPSTLSCEICPQSTPSWNSQTSSCHPCPDELPVFDYSRQRCVQKICFQGTKWNKLKYRCSPLSKTCLPYELYNFQQQKCEKMCNETSLYNPTTKTCKQIPCPVDKPFWNQTNNLCQACPLQTPSYNETLHSCTVSSCPINTKWNDLMFKCSPLTHKCETYEAYQFTSESCLRVCNKTQIYDNNLKQCNKSSCPDYRPLYDQTLKKCVKCPLQTPTFDKQTGTCGITPCESGYHWNTNLNKCSPLIAPCELYQSYNFTNESCVALCGPTETYFAHNKTCSKSTPNESKESCPTVRPYWNNLTNNCTKCPSETPLFNVTTQTCTQVTCLQGLKWNSLKKQCTSLLKCEPYQLFIFQQEQCIDICNHYEIYDSVQKSCNHTLCTTDKPMWNATGKYCQSCPPDIPIFNNVSQTCESRTCSQGLKWSGINLRCISACIFKEHYDPALKRCVKQQTVNITCAGITPFWNTTRQKCQPCPASTPYWNPNTQQCEQCPALTPSWNINTRRCEQCSLSTPYWNTTSQRCLPCPASTPSWNTINQQCEQCPASTPSWNPNIRRCEPCSLSIPYWNTTSQKCQQCSTLTPSWNTINQQCEQCPASTPSWNPNTRRCEQCLPTTPYWNPNNQKCQPCPASTPSWNTTNKNCQQCPASTPSWNPNTRRCEQCLPTTPYWNPNNQICQQCPALTPSWSTINQTCLQCPASTPSWNPNTRRCEPCSLSTPYWNPSSLLCQKCPLETPFFNTTQSKCVLVTCNANMKWDLNTSTCQCIPGYHYYKLYDSCQIQCPVGFYLNTQSMLCNPIAIPPTCGNNMYLDVSSKCTCLEGFTIKSDAKNCRKNCIVNYTYNQITDSCEINKIVCQPGTALNSVTGKCEVTCLAGQIYNATTSKCQIIQITCPSGSHYNTINRQCETCPPNSTYDFRTVLCTSNTLQCPDGFTFNPSDQQCYSNTHSCPAGYSYNQISKVCESNTLICPTNYKYNPVSKLCESIATACGQGSHQNPSTGLCELDTSTDPRCKNGEYFSTLSNTCQPLFTTKPTSSNLLTSDMPKYTASYNYNKTSNPKLQDCPNSNYDYNNKICVKCPDEYPYFNLDSAKCQNCGSGTYIKATFKCQYQEQTNLDYRPQLNRLVMNIL